MNKNARAWVEELRITDKEQGFQRLCVSGHAYCCLGIACELAVKAGVISQPQFNNVTLITRYGAEGTTYSLPEEVKEWLGLRDAEGTTSLSGGGVILILLNDTTKLSFKAIATVIEEFESDLFYKENINVE